MITVKFERSQVSVGSELLGTICWSSETSTVPKKVSLSVGWQTEGRGTQDKATISTIQLDPDQFALSREEEIPFSFSIPYEGPVTYDGKLVRILWSLRALIDMPGVFAKDDKQDFTFNVIPRQS